MILNSSASWLAGLMQHHSHWRPSLGFPQRLACIARSLAGEII
jgi:hypothetical protein